MNINLSENELWVLLHSLELMKENKELEKIIKDKEYASETLKDSNMSAENVIMEYQQIYQKLTRLDWGFLGV